MAERVPITLWQDYLLKLDSDPDSTPQFQDIWTLAVALQVKPRVDLRRLERAVTKLAERHDSLRLRFVKANGAWQGEIAPNAPARIETADLGPIANDADFEDKVYQLARRPLPLTGDVQTEVIVAPCGVRGDVLIFRVHHSITDGYGMIVLTEDLLKYLIGVPVLGKAVRHVDYVKRFQSPLGAAKVRNDAYWRAKLEDFPPTPNFGRKSKGLKPLTRSVGWSHTRNTLVRVSAADRRRWRDRITALRCPPPTGLFSAYGQALCETLDQDHLITSLPASRVGRELETFCGDHSLDAMTRHQRVRREQYEDAVVALQEDILQAVEHLPSDMVRRGGAFEAELIERGCHPRQFALRVPRATAREKKSIFASAFGAPPGQPSRMGPFEIRQLPSWTRVKSLDEMQAMLFEPEEPYHFRLGWDADAFTEAEQANLASRICEWMGVEVEGIDFSE